MSSSTAIPISPELENTFRTGNKRFIIVRIQNELLNLVDSQAKGGSLESDWAQIPRRVGNQAAYILVNVEPGKWVTLTFVPDSTSIKDKMLYAATKATLLNHLGYNNFGDDVHANCAEELTYKYYEGTLVPNRCYSAGEELVDIVNKGENEERAFRATREASRGIGGYHSVSMPLDNTAASQIRGLVSGAHNFVELAINPSKDGITGKAAKNVSGNYGPHISTTEPRYYLLKHFGGNVFLYCCPPKAPQQLRMVYSTAKGSVMNEAKSLGFNATRAGEISEASDITDNLLRELSSSRPVNPTGPTRATGDYSNTSKRNSTMESSHPVYSLMASPNSTKAKKIVIPPPGAY